MDTVTNNDVIGGQSSRSEYNITQQNMDSTGSSQEFQRHSQMKSVFTENEHAFVAQKMTENDQHITQGSLNLTENQVSQILREISSLGQSVQSVNTQLHSKLNSVENELLSVRARISEIEHPDKEVQFNFRDNNSTVFTNRSLQNNNRSENSEGHCNGIPHNTNQNMIPEIGYFPEQNSAHYNMYL